MALVLEIWLALLAAQVVFLIATVVLTRGLGGRVQRASLFLGPPIVRFSVASIPWAVGAIPLPGSYVQLVPSERPVENDPDRSQLHDLPRPKRLAIVLVPWLLVVLVCVLLLGPELAIGSLLRGLRQSFEGAIYPVAVGSSLVARLVELGSTEPWHRFGALVTTKLVAFNLLPIPSLAGGVFFWELVRPERSVTRPRWLAMLGTASLGLGVGWMAAVVVYLFGE